MLGPSARETLCAPSKSASLFPSALWSSCTHTLLAFKAKCSGVLPSNARPSDCLGGLFYVGTSLYRLCGFNVFQCVGCF